MDDWLSKILIGVSAAGSVMYGLTVVKFDVLLKVIPQYATYGYLVFLAAGGYLLYTLFKK